MSPIYLEHQYRRNCNLAMVGLSTRDCLWSQLPKEVVSQVKNIAKGDKILFTSGVNEQEKGSYQQYRVVPVDNTAKVPHNIAFDQAASVPTYLATVAAGIWAHEPGANSAGLPGPLGGGWLDKAQGPSCTYHRRLLFSRTVLAKL
ncbi:hypothetical protein L226DRAFT_609935 [Lentinus tigrinus ALCF2SS1-7]|uniref:uncharacterized protein n=1 Tax=Lentinus tigrinus ALCF2SS1-7 TaxID=1328758 RepID=UPI001165F0EE|nr:hypothetical protein L226DRAFT_609935 [Lentinus tigrinus ALCF2SS1-7]